MTDIVEDERIDSEESRTADLRAIQDVLLTPREYLIKRCVDAAKDFPIEDGHRDKFAGLVFDVAAEIGPPARAYVSGTSKRAWNQLLNEIIKQHRIARAFRVLHRNDKPVLDAIDTFGYGVVSQWEQSYRSDVLREVPLWADDPVASRVLRAYLAGRTEKLKEMAHVESPVLDILPGQAKRALRTLLGKLNEDADQIVQQRIGGVLVQLVSAPSLKRQVGIVHSVLFHLRTDADTGERLVIDLSLNDAAQTLEDMLHGKTERIV